MNCQLDLLPASLKMFVALVVVLCGLFIVLYFMKKFLKQSTHGFQNNQIEILSNRYIGIKKNICLVKVPGSVLVLGITSNNICLLDKIQDKEILDKLEPDDKRTPHSFLNQLHNLGLKKNKNKKSE